MIRKFLLGVVLTACVAMVWAQQSYTAQQIQQLKARAEAGDPHYQNLLGQAYATGNGVGENQQTAFHWYKKAAAGKNVAAYANLGAMYEYGYGVVSPDLNKAVMYYNKAAKFSQPNALLNLAGLYASGRLGKVNYALAHKYYQQVLNMPYRNTARMAAYNLAVLYQKGMGVAQSDKKAVRYFLRSAQLGFDKAQAQLAFSYQFGTGVEKNYATAYKWFKICSSNAYEVCKNGLKQLLPKMSKSQIAEGKKLYAAYQNANNVNQ